MATTAQIEANRANSQLSTGPKSAAGKQRSSLNHLSHGFRSTHVLLPGDDPAEYEALVADLTREFQPSNLTEQRYVREMADAEWRLRRARQWEQRFLQTYTAEIMADHPEFDPLDAQALAFDTAHTKTSLAACVRYGNQYQRQYDRAYQGLMQARKRAAAQPKPQPSAPAQQPISKPLNVLPFEANPVPTDPDDEALSDLLQHGGGHLDGRRLPAQVAG